MPSDVMTSMEKILGRKTELGEVKRSILKSYSRIMGTTLVPVEKVNLESEFFSKVVG
jgi:hypothetical protein